MKRHPIARDAPAFRLLHPGVRAVVGAVAAATAIGAGSFVFGPHSDGRALQMAGVRGAGNPGFVRSEVRLARGAERAPPRPRQDAPAVDDGERVAETSLKPLAEVKIDP